MRSTPTKGKEPVVWADEASPFTGAQVKALLEENEKLRKQNSISSDAAFAARALLTNSLTDIDFMHHGLTKTEKDLVTKSQFTELVRWIHGR